MRELFIEELAGVRGGVDPLEKILHAVNWDAIRDLLLTTYACGEEGASC